MVYQAFHVRFSIMRHVLSKYPSMRLCVRHTRVCAFLQISGRSNHMQYTNMAERCCVTCPDIGLVYVLPILRFLAHALAFRIAQPLKITLISPYRMILIII